MLFSLNNINFLGHVDAVYNKKEQLIKIIRGNFNINELQKIDIYIVVGEWCNNNCISINIIKNSLDELKLSYKILNNNKWKNTISIDNNNINII